MRFAELKNQEFKTKMSIEDIKEAIEERKQWLHEEAERAIKPPQIGLGDFLSPYRIEVLRAVIGFCEERILVNDIDGIKDNLQEINNIFQYALEDSYDWTKDINFFGKVSRLFPSDQADILKEKLFPTIAKSRLAHAAYMEHSDPVQKAAIEGYLMTAIVFGMVFYLLSDNPFFVLFPLLSGMTKIISLNDGQLALADKNPSLASRLVASEPFHSFFLGARHVLSPSRVIEGLMSNMGHGPELFPRQTNRERIYFQQVDHCNSTRVNQLQLQLQEKKEEIAVLKQGKERFEADVIQKKEALEKLQSEVSVLAATLREKNQEHSSELKKQREESAKREKKLEAQIDAGKNAISQMEIDLARLQEVEKAYLHLLEEEEAKAAASNSSSGSQTSKVVPLSPFEEQQKLVRDSIEVKNVIKTLTDYIHDLTKEKNGVSSDKEKQKGEKLAAAKLLLSEIQTNFNKKIEVIVSEQKAQHPNEYARGFLSARLHDIAEHLIKAEHDVIESMQSRHFHRN
ncbi:MAG: hypothetical protein AB7F64_00595 [Gammaproteobacteria bacterium]